MHTTLPKLLAAARAAKANPNLVINTGDWTNPHWTQADFWRWFWGCLQAKINAHDPRYPTGRKAGDEYQIELRRLRQYIGNRVIIDWVAPILGARVQGALEHRLRGDWVLG